MDLRPDPVLERIGKAVRAGLSTLAGPHGAGSSADGTAELAALRDLDALAYETPVEAGGFDLGLSCGVTICVELGRAALRDPYTGSLLAIEAFAAAGDYDSASAVGAGKSPVVTAGLDAVSGRAARRALPVADARAGGGFELSGATVVDDHGGPDAACCVAVDTPGGVRLATLPAEAWRPRVTGPRHRWRPSAGPLGVDLTGLTVADDAVIADLGAGRPLPDPIGLLARLRVRHAGYLLGLGQGAHELTVRYAGRRRQFDRALLDNQAVAFPLAEASIRLAGARLLAYRAAWQADAGEPFALAAVEALAWAAETALQVARLATQFHGARGLAVHSPIHRHVDVVRDAVTRLGSPGALWQEAGVRRLASTPPALIGS